MANSAFQILAVAENQVMDYYYSKCCSNETNRAHLLAVLVATGTTVYMMVVLQIEERFTEFYVSGLEGWSYI